MAEYIDGKRQISTVSNIVYKTSSSIVENPIIDIDVKDIKPIDFTGFDLKKYFIPEIVLSIQISKGCYWGKCTFCDFSYGKSKYSCSSPQQAVDVVEDIVKRYNIRYFQFQDEALSSAFLREFANEILKRKIKITYASFLRLENDFTYELLSLIYQSGYIHAIYGYEAYSNRIVKKMNKGINTDSRLAILKASSKVGIWNQVDFMYGFPNETIEEIIQTIDFIVNNRTLIHSLRLTAFALTKHSILGKKQKIHTKDKYNLVNSIPDYENKISEEDEKFILNYYSENVIKKRKHNISSIMYQIDYLILYLNKYGKEYCLNNYQT